MVLELKGRFRRSCWSNDGCQALCGIKGDDTAKMAIPPKFHSSVFGMQAWV